jgi:iron complex transport system permease protein
MLLAGIAITALCGGLTGLLIYYADESQLRDITFWNLGSLSGGNWSIIALISSITVLAGWKLIQYAPELEIMQLGDKESAYLGVPIERIKRTSIIMVCLMVGSSVAFTGLIGFVGLVVPHLIRLNVPTIGFKQLLILSGLVGSILLLLADTLARTIISPSELPIGILTAIMGAPFFLWLLVKNKY